MRSAHNKAASEHAYRAHHPIGRAEQYGITGRTEALGKRAPCSRRAFRRCEWPAPWFRAPIAGVRVAQVGHRAHRAGHEVVRAPWPVEPWNPSKLAADCRVATSVVVAQPLARSRGRPTTSRREASEHGHEAPTRSDSGPVRPQSTTRPGRRRRSTSWMPLYRRVGASPRTTSWTGSREPMGSRRRVRPSSTTHSDATHLHAYRSARARTTPLRIGTYTGAFSGLEVLGDDSRTYVSGGSIVA